MRNIIVVLCLVLIFVFLTMSLGACSQGAGDPETTDGGEDPPSEEVALISEATFAPTAAPDPIVDKAIDAYDYKKEISASLDVGFMYPSHWIREAGTSTIVYKRPANPGEVTARLALSAKKVASIPDNAKMAEYLFSFTEIVSRQYDDFVTGDILQDVMFINRPAFNQTYTATLGGVPVKGYIIMTCNTKKKLIYVMHFSAPASDYDALDPARQMAVDNVIILG